MGRVFVTGATGLLGRWVMAIGGERGRAMVAIDGPSRGVDLGDARAADGALSALARGDVVVHTAAMAAIGDCAKDPAAAKRANVDATANVAALCRARGARLVHVSTDLVFDGEAAPYAEEATPRPLSVYGATKRDAERVVLTSQDAIVVRVALLFGPSLGPLGAAPPGAPDGPTPRRGFFDMQLATIRRRGALTLFDDEWRTPLSFASAAEGLLAIASRNVDGLLHLGGPERMSRLAMGERLLRFANTRLAIGEGASLLAVSRTSVPGEPRARDVSLACGRFESVIAGEAEVVRGGFEDECARMFTRLVGDAAGA